MHPVFFLCTFSDEFNHFFAESLDKCHQIWYSECVPCEHESGGVSHVLFRGGVKAIRFCTAHPCTRRILID